MVLGWGGGGGGGGGGIEHCVRCSVFRRRDVEEEHLKELDIDGRVMLQWLLK